MRAVMAQKFAFMPESQASQPDQLPEKSSEPNLENLPELLPKNMRGKARILVHYLNGINVNNMQRIVYNDGVVGSHVLDLIRYTVSPFSNNRPLDWPDFKKILEQCNVPDSVYCQKSLPLKRKTSALDNWIVY